MVYMLRPKRPGTAGFEGSEKSAILGYAYLIHRRKNLGREITFGVCHEVESPSKSIRIRRSKRLLTDEEMALPGIAPTAEELEQWLLLPDGKGSSVEVSRKRLLNKFRKEFGADNK